MTILGGVVTATEGNDRQKPIERMLAHCVERGEVLDLAGDEAVDEAAMRTWDDSRIVSASVIRDILRGRLVTEPDPHGVRLRGARIAGRLDLVNITSAAGLELYDCLLDEGLAVAGANLAGVVLAGCRIEHPYLPALSAERLRTPQLNLNRAIIAADAPQGAVALNGAHLGELACDGARLCNESGPALDASWLRVDREMLLRGRFEAVGAGQRGTIDLSGAHLGGLNCADGKLCNESGPALNAGGLRVDQGVALVRQFEAIGAGGAGAVWLAGAQLGYLECDGAKLRNESGPALSAKGLRVEQSVYMCHGFEASGVSEYGTVRIHDAQVGTLYCTGAKLRNDSGPALVAGRLQVDQKLFLDDVEALGAGPDAVIDLADVRVGGTLVFKPAQLQHREDPHARIGVDGLVYAGLPQGIHISEWLRLLRDGTPDYAAQPYQHLAAVHRAAGHEAQARRILMAQRRDQLHRHSLTGRAERMWTRFTGLTLGYGYQPWRALIGLLVVIGTAVVLAVVLGGYGGLAQVRNPTSPTLLPCTPVERIGVGLDLGTPLISTGIRGRCDATNTATGQALTVTGWALRLLAWAFATLFIAGFTSAVRQT